MLNTASYYLAYLQEEDQELLSMALNKINLLIETNWAEISDYIIDFKISTHQITINNKRPNFINSFEDFL